MNDGGDMHAFAIAVHALHQPEKKDCLLSAPEQGERMMGSVAVSHRCEGEGATRLYRGLRLLSPRVLIAPHEGNARTYAENIAWRAFPNKKELVSTYEVRNVSGTVVEFLYERPTHDPHRFYLVAGSVVGHSLRPERSEHVLPLPYWTCEAVIARTFLKAFDETVRKTVRQLFGKYGAYDGHFLRAVHLRTHQIFEVASPGA
ncbi:MAG: hypothetical protein ABI747_01565 [Candidatus Moraniibacteriota bacterium]